MFSSNSLIQIVFGYFDDLYFTAGTVMLDLDSYLCLELRRNFDEVCFIKTDAKHMPYIYSYNKKGEAIQKRMFKSINKTVADCISKKLTESRKKTAVVIDANDFCTFFSLRDDFKPISELLDAKQRQKVFGSIILVFPPVAEVSAELLLRSPVFEYLGDSSILSLRSGDGVPLFSQLLGLKRDSCFFLNTFNYETVRNILTRVMLELPERFFNNIQLDFMAKFLTYYLNNRQLYWKVKIFDDWTAVLIHHRFRQLYEQLKDQRVWNRLLAETNECRKICSSDTRMDKYMQVRGVSCSPKKQHDVFITRAENTIAYNCLMISPLYDEAAEGEYNRENLKMFDAVCERLLSPMNLSENEEIAKILKETHSNLIKISKNRYLNTYNRSLKIMDILTEMLYYPPDSKCACHLISKKDVLFSVISRSFELDRMLLKGQAKTEAALETLGKCDRALDKLIDELRGNNIPIDDISDVDPDSIYIPDDILDDL